VSAEVEASGSRRVDVVGERQAHQVGAEQLGAQVRVGGTHGGVLAAGRARRTAGGPRRVAATRHDRDRARPRGLVPLVIDPTGLPLLLVVVALAVTGAGVGLSMPLQLGALHDVGQADIGMATGMFLTSRYLGSIAGASLLAPATAGDFTVLFALLAGTAAIGVAVVGALPRHTTAHGSRSRSMTAGQETECSTARAGRAGRRRRRRRR
jgi:hypothetical protein